MGKAYVVAVAVLLGGIIGMTFVFREIYILYSQADANIRLGVITATGSAGAFVINNIVQSSRERRSRLFEAKREEYSRFFRFFMTMFHRAGTDDPVEQQELVAELRGLSISLITWGGSEAINAFNSFAREAAENPTIEGYQLYNRAEAFLRALRKDLGHADGALGKFALTKLIIRGDEHRMLDALSPRD